MKESKYLQFVFWSRTGKTEKYNIVSKAHGNVLGEVKWFGRWRQYCFFPANVTVFNPGCLQDIIAFIGELMAERKKVKS